MSDSPGLLLRLLGAVGSGIDRGRAHLHPHVHGYIALRHAFGIGYDQFPDTFAHL